MNWFFLAIVFYLTQGSMEVKQLVLTASIEDKDECLVLAEEWKESVVEKKPRNVDILWLEVECISRPIEGQVRM